MKLDEVLTNPGTYVSVKFNDDTNVRLLRFIQANNIPNGLKSQDLHSTIITSPDLDINEFTSLGVIKPHWVGYPVKCIKLTPYSIAVQYTCVAQVERHDQIIELYNCTDKYGKYTVHASLSYRVPIDLDETLLDVSSIGPLYIISESFESVSQHPYQGIY